MSFIIGKKCVSTCDTACVDVCPVDCIHGPIDVDGAGAEVEDLRKKGKLKGLQLFIDPDMCIDCGACDPECPVEAIYEESDVPDEWNKYIKINYDFFGREMD